MGLPVAITFAEEGFPVIGLDIDEERIRILEGGGSYLGDLPPDRVKEAIADKQLSFTSSYPELSHADVVLISVPTPLADGVPDLSLIEAAGDALSEILRPGMLVILESTTYPGTTEELLQPRLELSGLKAGEDFLLAYSPERIDPGNPVYEFADIPKVVGGIDQVSTQAAVALYQQVLLKVFAVSGTREAELTKLIENTFRHVNIALVNELAVYANEMGVDIWQAIEAAATKPFGFLPFWPGPGWGGHCIPLDPAYLSWKVRRHRSHEVRFVELAQAINSEMPRYVLERISILLNERGKPIKGSKILGVGVAYKGGTEDTRESAGIKVLSVLAERGAEVAYHDPLVPEVKLNGRTLRTTSLGKGTLAEFDVVVVLVPQEKVDWELIADAPLVFDCCNALGKRGPNVIRL